MTTVTGNMLIAQSGGPSMVINQSLVGAVLEAKEHKCIRRILGAKHGIQGILDQDFVNLRKETPSTLEAVAQTPSSALGTVRKKPSDKDCRRIFSVLRKHEVRYFFYIGGNDSAETANIISEEATSTGFDLKCFHIPKTIDNDLRENDHTPGFGSAARFVVCALIGDNLDNRALPGVKIDVIMGRDAGFLTAASALARLHPNDGPHLIYLPERTFTMKQFRDDVWRVYQRLGRCVVAVSEGIKDRHGNAIAAKYIHEIDPHGNKQFSGSGILGDVLAAQVKKRKSMKRVRADTFGYLQRSFPDVVSDVDAREAREVGHVAVREAIRAPSGSIAIKRADTRKYKVFYERVPLNKVARDTREMPSRFISRSGTDVTPAFIDYVTPLVGTLPGIARLREHSVA